MTLGEALRRERERKGWSRETLAKHSGTSVAAIARTELYGKSPRIVTLAAWAQALGVSVGDLVQSGEAA